MEESKTGEKKEETSGWKEEPMSEKEKRVRAITNMYYSNPKVLETLNKFSADREVVPRYFEAFGKRPDKIQYPSDILGLVKKGATSFHASEELWNDALGLNSEITQEEMNKMRKSWDLLIDVDSPFLDCSKIATRLIIAALEQHGIKNYGIKFSGSKGFHIIISGRAFPEEYNGQNMKESFPEWPRAISEYLMHNIKSEYSKEIRNMNIDFAALERRTNLKKEDIVETVCPECGKPSKKGRIVVLVCPECKLKIERKDVKLTSRKLKCLNDKCAGFLEIAEEKDYFYCDYCKNTSWDKIGEEGANKVVMSKEFSNNFQEGFEEEFAGEKIAALDLVLVAPRHLFRMPYSLHEKTALASVVIKKEDLDNFNPKMANPLNVKVVDYLPLNEANEARMLLSAALEWKRTNASKEEEKFKREYENREFEAIDSSKVTEDMFPEPIKKLLRGLKDGKKRGLFVLLTFLRSVNFSPEYINVKVREWNKLNEPPLKEGYIKSQIEWNLKQKRKILPPNYDNNSFYKDLGLLDGLREAKNPLSEIAKKLRFRNERE